MALSCRRATPSSFILETGLMFLHTNDFAVLPKETWSLKMSFFQEDTVSLTTNYFKWASCSEALIYKLVEACLCSTVTK